MELLDLPLDALQHILKYLNPIDLIIFSFSSKSTLQLAKNTAKSPKLKMEIHSLHRGCIKILYPNFGQNYTFFALEEKDEKVKKNANVYTQILGRKYGKFFKKSETRLVFFWKDKIEGLLELAKHVSELFNYPEISVVYTDTQYMNRELYESIKEEFEGKIVKWVADTSHTDTSPEDMTYILDTCKMAKDLTFYSTRSCTDMEYEFIDFNMDSIRIEGAKWLNLKNLCELSHEALILTILNCSLANKDMKKVIEKWIDEEKELKLKLLTIEYPDIKIGKILYGLEHEKLEDGLLTESKLYNQTVKLNGGFKIRKDQKEMILHMNTVFNPPRLDILFC